MIPLVVRQPVGQTDCEGVDVREHCGPVTGRDLARGDTAVDDVLEELAAAGVSPAQFAGEFTDAPAIDARRAEEPGQ